MDLKTSFKILGLVPEADEALTKRAYKDQVRRWHPDQFPQGSVAKAGADEQLKQINIAYARVKAHLASRRPVPGVTGADTTSHPPRFNDTPGEKSKTRVWVDHLFEALNAFAGNHDGGPRDQPAAESDANRRKTFGQVLDEMAGGNIAPKPKRQSANPVGAARAAAGYRRHRRRGSVVGAVGGTESPGPVKPVSRVRGIGRRR